MRWLRGLLYSEDPIVKVAAGLSEPDATLMRDALADADIPALAKNMNFLSITYGGGAPLGNDLDLFVKRSDLARARKIVARLAGPGQLVDER